MNLGEPCVLWYASECEYIRPLNSNACLSLGVSQGLWLPVSLQVLFLPATVSQVEEKNNIYLLKVGRIRDTEAGLMVKIFNYS